MTKPTGKPVGRPPGRDYTGKVLLRLKPAELDKLDAWCARAGMQRAPAIRRAIERLVRTDPRRTAK